MEEDFYAVIKLTSGEEIISIVSPSTEEDQLFLILNNPATIEVITLRQMGIQGYKVDPWIKISDDDTFLVSMDKVITISEIRDPETIEMYNKFLTQQNSKEESNKKSNNFLSVSKARKMFEKLYRLEEESKDS